MKTYSINDQYLNCIKILEGKSKEDLKGGGYTSQKYMADDKS
jgi:hypothetical protein